VPAKTGGYVGVSLARSLPRRAVCGAVRLKFAVSQTMLEATDSLPCRYGARVVVGQTKIRGGAFHGTPHQFMLTVLAVGVGFAAIRDCGCSDWSVRGAAIRLEQAVFFS